MLKVKVGLIGIFDMLKFKNLKRDRLEAIENTPAKPLKEEYYVNHLARIFHPEKQHLVIKEIIEENYDTKTFVLTNDKESETKELAPFKAGSYISIMFKNVATKKNVVARTYSLSSSPKEALNNIYKVTIKRKSDGLLSSYLLDEAKVNDKLIASEVGGNLTYNKLRDAKNVIALAGGTGITPFLSMAKAINEKSEDFNLTILYGVRTLKDKIFEKEFKEIEENTNHKVKVVYVLSEENNPNYEHGFIDVNLIKKYAPKDEQYSIFAAGPSAMIEFLDKELSKLNLEKKFIRIERTATNLDISDSSIYNIKVNCEHEVYEIKANANETILTALERSGLPIRSKCHLGGCGFCRSRIIKGTYVATKYEQLRMTDKKYHFFHPCCSYPTSDMEIEIFKY